MRKLLLVVFLLCAALSVAQTVPTTPNLGLYIPYHGTTNWDTYVNANMTSLDNYLSGGQVLQNLTLGKAMLQQYMDFQAISAPANPAAGICRVYFDLSTSLWKGVNSTGASCSPVSNNSGGPFQIAVYVGSGTTTLSPDTSCTLNSGALTCPSLSTNGAGTPKIDFTLGTSPGNPTAGNCRVYADSTATVMTFLNSTGGNCLTTSTTGQLVFNSSGVLAGIANFTWTAGTHTLASDSSASIDFSLAASLKIPSNSTGTTPTVGDNSTKVATTAFVAASYAPLASPVFTGTMTIPNVNSTGGLLQSTTAPTISSGFGTTPSVVNSNSTQVFTINVGTGGTATSGVIGLPAAAHGWSVSCNDITTTSATVFLTKQTGTTTTTATVGNFNTSGAAAAWVASDVLSCRAAAY